MDRFRLKVHFEFHDASVYALTLAKPGKLGPSLQPHSAGPPCPDTADLDSPQVNAADKARVFPPICRNLMFERTPDGSHTRWGSRNVTMAALASLLPRIRLLGPGSQPIITRPVVDQTGLSGTYDFKIEYAAPPRDAASGGQLDNSGEGLFDAMREQLGVQLKSSRAPIRTLVIDRVDRPSGN